MRIDVYLDNAAEPCQTLTPPETFRMDTTTLSDGQHELRLVAIDEDGVTSERRMPFAVQNGPTIAIHGLVDHDTIAGEVNVLANAYGSKIGDAFEPTRIETPAPIPTWAWVLFLCIFAWGTGYVALELNQSDAPPLMSESPSPDDTAGMVDTATADWAELGAQVYGNTCSSCHQLSGAGLAGVFPPLVNNPAVMSADPTDHINAIINGLSGEVIDGIAYPGPMPPFGAILSDEEVAAVVNHERSNWGNHAPLIRAADVQSLRNQAQR